MKKTLFVLVFALVFFAASIAMAKVNFGVKYFSLTNLTNTSFGEVFTQNNNQILGMNLGFDVTPQVVILAGLELNSLSWKEEITVGEESEEAKLNISSFTPNVGVKYYLKERTDNSVCPYLFGGFFKTFTSVDATNYMGFTKEEEDLIKGVNSPFGLVPAFGAEYFFSENFSFGGELGLRVSFAKGDYTVTEPSATYSQTYNTINQYVALTLNFRF